MAEDENPIQFPTAGERLRSAVIAAKEAGLTNQEVVAAIAPLWSHKETGPPNTHLGTNGRWEKLGTVGVDSATIGILDPAFGPRSEAEHEAEHQRRMSGIHDGRLATGYGNAEGVQFMSGFGDGGYDVWGWVANYAKPSEPVDERIAQVVLVLITPDDLRDWHGEGVMSLG